LNKIRQLPRRSATEWKDCIRHKSDGKPILRIFKMKQNILNRFRTYIELLIRVLLIRIRQYIVNNDKKVCLLLF
jgi:hypothetical protein